MSSNAYIYWSLMSFGRCMRMKKEANSVMIHSTTTIKPADNIDTALPFSAVTADQCGYSYNL